MFPPQITNQTKWPEITEKLQELLSFTIFLQPVSLSDNEPNKVQSPLPATPNSHP
jgi:hypothetical protein